MRTSGNDLIELLDTAVRQAAVRLLAGDAKGKGIGEMLRLVRRRDPETYALLEAFADAYLECYRIRRRMDDQASADPGESVPASHLAESIARRDLAWETLRRRVQGADTGEQSG